MTSAEVVETKLKVTTNSPSQDVDYVHSPSQTIDHNLATYDMTPEFKPITARG